ncbi:MAG: zinc ribbon domain-containing protein [Dehalococcoidia bacterium]
MVGNEQLYRPEPDGFDECDESCDTCEVRITRNCQSCGMPMNNPGDFGGGNEENDYCVHCTNADGTLKSYDEIYEGLVFMYINSRNMEKEDAEQAAREYMAMMPAWAGL